MAQWLALWFAALVVPGSGPAEIIVLCSLARHLALTVPHSTMGPVVGI